MSEPDVPTLAAALPEGCTFSSDPARLDRALVHRWLAEDTYWGTGRTREQQDALIDAALSFGVYDADGAQLAFARLVTDRVTIGWLGDVYVAREARGRGIGVALIAGVVEAVDAMGLRRTMLTTGDAQSLYTRFGFAVVGPEGRLMLRGQE